MNAPNPYIGDTQRPQALGTATHQKILETTDPEQVSLTHKYGRVFSVYGYKATSATENTNNAGDVFLGWSATSQPIILEPGAELTIKADDGRGSKDLSNMWIRGAIGDGVYLQWDSGIT